MTKSSRKGKIETIKQKVIDSIKELYDNDPFLIQKDVNERSITHKLATYLQNSFADYDVDCEYNRMIDQNADEGYITKTLDLQINDIKSNDTEACTVYPDIIVHKRGSNNNLLVIEVKKATNQAGNDFDIKKIEAYIKQLGYQYGVFIKLGNDVDKVNYEWETRNA